jgi:hypothetical protein
MLKKLMLFMGFFLFFMIFAENKAFASGTLTLTMKDLTFWNISPNDATSSSVKKLEKTFKQLDFDKAEDGYITGDPTP